MSTGSTALQQVEQSLGAQPEVDPTSPVTNRLTVRARLQRGLHSGLGRRLDPLPGARLRLSPRPGAERPAPAGRSATVSAVTADLRLSVLDQTPVSEGSTGAQALRNSIDLARLADGLGYHRYWVAEHHGGAAGRRPVARRC